MSHFMLAILTGLYLRLSLPAYHVLLNRCPEQNANSWNDAMGKASNVAAADSQQVTDFRTTRVRSGKISTRDLAGPLRGRCLQGTMGSAT